MRSKTTFPILLSVGLVLATVGVFFKPVHAQTWVEGHITSNTTWTVADSPYRAINDVIVDPGFTLSIEPGVTVEFADGFSLIVNGTLHAVGTSDGLINFTSSRPVPSPGMWNTIKFIGGKNEAFIIKHSIISYAENGITIESNGQVLVEKSNITKCSESGILVAYKGSFVIKGNIIEKNKNGISIDGEVSSGVMLIENQIIVNTENGINAFDIYNATVSNNTILANGMNGLHLSTGNNVTISNNKVSLNGKDGIYATNAYNVTMLWNIVFSNGRNGIYLQNSRILSDILIDNNNVSSNNGEGIYVCATGTVIGSVARSILYNLEITSNTMHHNSGNGIDIRSISSTYSDMAVSVLYDVIVLGNNLTSNGGSGICLTSNAHAGSGWGRGQIYNITIANNTVLSCHHGMYLISEGSHGYGSIDSSYIYNVSISSNKVSQSTEDAIHLHATHRWSSPPSFDLIARNNLISENNRGILIPAGIKANITHNSISYGRYGIFFDGSVDNEAHQNDIYENHYGMNVTGGATVDAEYNYWGDSNGPYQLSLNPEGEGNPVNGDGTDLDFIPFLTSPVGTINERPVAVLEVDKTNPNVYETVTFDASASTDDGRIDYYFFDFGDGTNSSWTPLSVVTHKYASEDTYNATLIVMDDFGVTSLNGGLVYTEITVVPEFPSLLILPLFMIATLVAVIIYRRKHSM